MRKCGSVILGCKDTFSMSLKELKLWEDRGRSVGMLGKCRRKSSIYSKLSWQVNLPGILSVIQVGKKRDHPLQHHLRYLLQEERVKEGRLGKCCRKRFQCSRVTWHVSLPGSLTAVRKEMKRRLALP